MTPRVRRTALTSFGLAAALVWCGLAVAAPGPTTNWVEAPTSNIQNSPAADTTVAVTAGTARQSTESSGVRSWLAQPPPVAGVLPSRERPAGLDLTTTLGLLLLLALAATAVWMKRRRLTQVGVDQLEAQARLAVLSTTRLGPKSHAVSVTAGGRIMLLGVTEHAVTHLAWLDEAADDVLMSQDSQPSPDLSTMDPVDDSLPDDYPGSALRAAQTTTPPPPLANAQDLARFEKLLQGAGGDRPGSALSRPGPSAASALANRTVDILGSSAGAIAEATPLISLRRKRQRRRAAAATPRTSAPSATSSATTPNPFEGQVAGLQAMRTRRSANEP